MNDTATDDPTVTALLAMAEFFLAQRPLAVSEAARCLLGVLSLQPVPRVEASVRLRLGLLLSQHTMCVMEAKEHLEKAMLVAGTAASLHAVRFHAASSLSSLLARHGQQHQARGLLRGKLEATVHHPYWHIRLLLQLADLLSHEGDVSGQLSTLSRCADYAHSIGASHTHLLATLARGAVLLTHHKYSEAGSVLNQASTVLEVHSSPLLRTFYLTIQVTHLLMAGQVKTAKPHLKQLQQCVQSLSNQPEEKAEFTSDLLGSLSAEDFLWLSKPHIYITVYLVSVLHSVQGGFTDKALSYVDRAMQLITQETTTSMQPCDVLGVLRAHVLEQSVQCLLMRGETVTAATQIQVAVDTCHAHHTLVYSHRAVLHTLLGLYAFATSSLDRAITQFQTALQHTNCKELRVLISLNLAISYMKVGVAKEVELAALMTSLNSDGTNITCQSLQSAVSYVRGMYSFTCGRLHDAKRQLRETLTVANSTDLNKLTSCALLLLGQIFLALGNTKETLDMVGPALQLSAKMPENRLQVWAASLLADLYHTLSEGEKEKLLRHQSYDVLKKLQQDEEKAVSGEAHSLLQWTIGEWPATAPEDKGHEKVSTPNYHTPPRRGSLTLNGSPVAMKTPEILLKRVDSPNRTTPPRSLLTMTTKLQTTPTYPQPPPTNSHCTPTRHTSSPLSVSANPNNQRLEGGGVRGNGHPPPTHSDTSHLPPGHRDTPHLPPGHRDTPHLPPGHRDTFPPGHRDTPHLPPGHRDTPHLPPGHRDTSHLPPGHRDTPHLPPGHRDTPHLPPGHRDTSHQDHTLRSQQRTHPLTHNQIIHGESPHPHSSPSHHSRKTQSPRAQSSPSSHSPHAVHSPHFYHHISPHSGQDSKLPHHSPLHQAPSLPSYEQHSLAQHSHTPPSLSQSLGPQSSPLHHLSHSNTPPPPSRVTTHISHTHMDPAVEQHMLQTQQQLLWQQKYIEAQQSRQRMAQSGPYLHPVAPHPGIGPGLSPHYLVPSGMSLTPPQLSHMATLQQISREPSRSHLHGVSSLPPGSVLGAVHLLPGQPTETQYRHGHQRP